MYSHRHSLYLIKQPVQIQIHIICPTFTPCYHQKGTTDRANTEKQTISWNTHIKLHDFLDRKYVNSTNRGSRGLITTTAITI